MSAQKAKSAKPQRKWQATNTTKETMKAEDVLGKY